MREETSLDTGAFPDTNYSVLVLCVRLAFVSFDSGRLGRVQERIKNKGANQHTSGKIERLIRRYAVLKSVLPHFRCSFKQKSSKLTYASQQLGWSSGKAEWLIA
jgi:hypothetical protein